VPTDLVPGADRPTDLVPTDRPTDLVPTDRPTDLVPTDRPTWQAGRQPTDPVFCM
jgi:hypothetical protein